MHGLNANTVFRLLIPTFLSLYSATVIAQPAPNRQEISQIEVTGNESIGRGKILDAIESKESPGGVSKFFYRTFGEKLGSRPEYFDRKTFDGDLLRIKDLYESAGFYHTAVEGSYSLNAESSRVDLLFRIRENARSLIDSIGYTGLGSLPPEVAAKIFNEPAVQKGEPYEKAKAASEISRILRILNDNGYPAARFDYPNSSAGHRASTDNFVLRFVFQRGRFHRFGEITVKVDPPRDDIVDYLALRHLDFVPGDVYSREKKISSEGNLNRLGIFESARVDHPAITDSVTADSIPIEVTVRPRPRNELSPEVIVSDENNALNIGLGLGYTNRNFLGDARLFNAHVRGRTQSIRDLFGGKQFRDTSVIGAVDLQFEILQPYLFTRTLSASWKIDMSGDKQKLYILSILRNRMTLNKRFTQYTYGILEWTLERVSPEILDTLPVTLRDEDQRQFNSILTASIQSDHTNDLFSPTEGYFRSLTVDESGILPKLLPGLTSGLPFTQFYRVSLFGRWYTDVSQSRFSILAAKLKLGYQDKYGESRSNTSAIPLNRRFFAGGSGSVRGWRPRELGAMADELLQFGGNADFEGSLELRVNHFRGFGRILAVNFDNIWGVYFLDIGNVWSDIGDVKPRDVAVAAGIGFRYETFFGPFRVDYGFRVYDPKGEAGRQTIFRKRLFGETLSNGVLSFGIGHAF